MAPFSNVKRGLTALSVACLAALYVASPARAVVIVGVEAAAANDGPFSVDNENLPQNMQVVSAAAGAGIQVSGVPSNDAILNPGPLPGCVPCATIGPGSAGVGRAEANGLTGSLKIRAEAYGEDSSGSSRARLQDTITFLGSKVINLEVDADTFASEPSAEFTLFFSIGFFDNANPDNPFTPVYFFGADEDGYFIEVGGTEVESGTGLPASLDATVDLAPFLLFGQTAPLEIRMSASAQCDDTSCLARVIADNSLHLTIDGPYVSAEGYVYDALPTAVPEPVGGLVLATALAALCRSRRRR
jgi:hypothetical protein